MYSPIPITGPGLVITDIKTVATDINIAQINIPSPYMFRTQTSWSSNPLAFETETINVEMFNDGINYYGVGISLDVRERLGLATRAYTQLQNELMGTKIKLREAEEKLAKIEKLSRTEENFVRGYRNLDI